MKFEIWAERDNGEKLHLSTKFTIEAAEQRQDEERDRGFFPKVWIKSVEE